MKTKKILLLTAFLCAGMLAQAQIELSFNPTKDKAYVYRIKTEQSIKQSVMGNDVPVSTVSDMLIEMKSKGKNNNEVSMAFFYKEIAMTVSSPMMNIKYDSKNTVENKSEVEEIIAQIFSSFIGKPMNIIFALDGSVKSISGLDAITSEIKKNTNSGNAVNQQMLSGVLQMFNEDALKQMFEQLFRMYPGKKVITGDSWAVGVSYDLAGMTNDVKNTYTLKSLEKDIASLDRSPA